MVCDSSGGNIVGYIPLLPGEQLLEDVFSFYEKRDFATMVVIYISPSIVTKSLLLSFFFNISKWYFL